MDTRRQQGLFLILFGAIFGGISMVLLLAAPDGPQEFPELLWVGAGLGIAALLGGIRLALPSRRPYRPRRAVRKSAPQPMTPLGIVLFSLVFIGLGALMVAQALGVGEFLGQLLVPNWVFGAAGLAILLAGIAILLHGLGAGKRAGSALVTVAILAFAVTFHYAVFVEDLGRWTGMGIGPLSAGEAARIGVVTVDLYILFTWVAASDTQFGRYLGAAWKKMEAADDPHRKKYEAAFFLAPPLLALILHFTGALNLIASVFAP